MFNTIGQLFGAIGTFIQMLENLLNAGSYITKTAEEAAAIYAEEVHAERVETAELRKMAKAKRIAKAKLKLESSVS